ncbi:zf-HC2 domain-containing protein [Streptomyces sp. NPDC001985]|uniref:zf-HC2 domain-containing protein n=1 Tax=Streptomyces sp. NPDC001985 TaxID=3154406 RepID=UPI003327FFE9
MTEEHGADAHVRLLLGAYVLDALSPEENALVACHVQRCDGCRDEYLVMAEMPMLLAGLSEAELLDGGDPSPGPDDGGAGR